MSTPVKRGPRATTIADVAREAAVSAMTVSRVVNNDTRVSVATRALVDAAIRRLNYSPNLAARSLAGAQVIRIGLLYANPSANYLSELLVGTLDSASHADVQLVVERCPLGEEAAVATRLLQNGIDGLVLSSPLCDSAALIRTIAAANVPAVALGSGIPSPNPLAVSIDEFAAAETMTRHIIGLGHRRIGFVTGDATQSESVLRLAGYRAALASAAIAADVALIAPGQFTFRSGLDAGDRLLDATDPPTAIFASNDDMAAGVITAAHRRGLVVPAELTLCGFDNTTLATAIWPELTTIHQPIAEMARAGLTLLAREIRSRRAGSPSTNPHITLDVFLVKRDSDGAPKATFAC